MSKGADIATLAGCGSVGGVPRKLLVGQAHAVHFNLVGPHRGGRLEALGASGGDEVILVNPVAAHAQSSHQHTILIEGQTAGEKHDSVLIGVGGL